MAGVILESGVLGDRELFLNLKQRAIEKRLSSALLVAGEPGRGQVEFLKALGQVLVCESERPACGHCGPCLRFAKEQSESLFWVRPEKNQIKIDQAQNVREFFVLQKLGKARVVVIEDAHLLNVNAANLLLKTLEEPPADSYLFLTAPSPRHLLPTLRSRVQSLVLKPLNISAIPEFAQDEEWLKRLSRGSVSKARELKNPAEIELRKVSVDSLKSWLQDPQSFLNSDWREDFKPRESAGRIALHLLHILRDSFFSETEAQELLLQTDLTALQKDLANLPKALRLRMAQQALELESQLRGNQDSVLAFERFWIHSEHARLEFASRQE